MSDLLKGNYKVDKPVSVDKRTEETLEERFEREAMKRLGGSIAFVSKKKIKWDKEESGS